MKGDFSKLTFAPDKNFLRVLMQQGRVQLDADWNEQAAILLHYLQTLAGDLIGPYAGPEGHWGFEIKKGAKGDFAIGAGRYYVDGLLCENHRDGVRYLNQPDYILDVQKDALSQGVYLVYLDVWERHISHIEDDSIREVALNGLDTASRSKLIWQVKVKKPKEGQPFRTCQDAVSALNQEEWILSEVCLRARVKPVDAKPEPCCQRPDAKYRGEENQLYRVETHHPGDGAAIPATFKWSRENGCVLFQVKGIASDVAANRVTVELETLGRDDKLSLSVNDWVELLDDAAVLKNDVNPLCQVYAIDPVSKTVVLTGATPILYDSRRHPLLRRWDQKGDADGLVVKPNEWLPIESGIEVEFDLKNKPLRSGDYWLIPARVNTGNVEWPSLIGADGNVIVDTDGNPLPAAKRPYGVEHHYAPLAIVDVDSTGAATLESDCRCSFRPLSYGCQYSDDGRLGQGIGTDLLCSENT